MMKNSYRFFENRDCEYYPCHEGIRELNCLFCYCPMYSLKDCPGNPDFKERDGCRIKVCRDCAYPHRPENYEKVLERIRQSQTSGYQS